MERDCDRVNNLTDIYGSGEFHAGRVQTLLQKDVCCHAWAGYSDTSCCYFSSSCFLSVFQKIQVTNEIDFVFPFSAQFLCFLQEPASFHI